MAFRGARSSATCVEKSSLKGLGDRKLRGNLFLRCLEAFFPRSPGQIRTASQKSRAVRLRVLKTWDQRAKPDDPRSEASRPARDWDMVSWPAVRDRAVMRKNTTPAGKPITVRSRPPVVVEDRTQKGSASKVTTITAHSLAIRDQK